MSKESLAAADFTDHLLYNWSAKIKCPKLSISDVYFGAGGSAMLTIEMLMANSGTFNKEMNFAECLKKPYIRRLCELLRD
jgi:hypothetical protein